MSKRTLWSYQRPPIPADLLERTAPDAVRAAVAHIDQMAEAEDDAHLELGEATNAVRSAEAADKRAAVAALRAGQSDPGAPATAAAKLRIADATRRVEVAEAARMEAGRDFGKALGDAARGPWVTALDAEADTARAEAIEHLDAIHAPLLAYAAAVGGLRWVSAYPERPTEKFGRPPGHVDHQDLRRALDTVRTILTQLDTDRVIPAHERPTPPLRPVPTAA